MIDVFWADKVTGETIFLKIFEEEIWFGSQVHTTYRNEERC